MTINAICDEVYRLFLLRTKGGNKELLTKLDKIGRYFFQRPIDNDSLKCFFDLERKIVASSGPNKKYIEDHIFKAILIGIQSAAVKRDVALNIVDFTKEIFLLKIPRDSFNSKRKAFALEILMHLSERHEIPDSLRICQESLESNKKDLIIAAVAFYGNHCRRNQVPLDAHIIETLDKIVLRTKSRSVAVCCLNLQVETEHISEMEALSRIDEWKEKNLSW